MLKVGDRVEVRPPGGYWWRGVMADVDNRSPLETPLALVQPDLGQFLLIATLVGSWVDERWCVPLDGD